MPTRFMPRRRPAARCVVEPCEDRRLMAATAVRLAVTPGGQSLADNSGFKYTATAYDAAGKMISPAPAFTWTVAGGPGGSVDKTGFYRAPKSGTGTTTLKVTAGKLTATAPITVTANGLFADADVGSPKLPGHFSYSGSTYAVTAAGTDIWSTADQFNYAYTKLTGNAVLEARVTAVGNTDYWSKGGVMYRDGTAANARDVYLITTPHNEVQLLARTAAGAEAITVGSAPNVTGPTWLKLVRQGNTFTGLYSTNGTSWNVVGSPVTVNLPATANAGLVATSHNVAATTTATFDDVAAFAQPTTGVYRLASRGQPNLSLDIEGWNNTNGANVSLFNANHTSNQQWRVENEGDGTFKLYAFSGANSLQMLDLTNGQTANGTAVKTYEDNGNDAQRWLFVPTSSGYYRIVPKDAENSTQTLEIAGGDKAGVQARTDVWSYHGGTNQQFSLQPPGDSVILSSPKKGQAGYLGQAAATHAAWAYDWGTGGQVPAGVEYDPMVWGYYGNANNGFANWVGGFKANGAKVVLGLNEPDSPTQANSTVDNALEAWGLLQGAGLPLVSPAAVHADGQWMRDFMAGAAARGYRVDAVAIHWYGGNDPAGFINYVNYIHQLYNKPVWITEFAPADWSGNGGVSTADATSFMRQVIPQLNNMDFVQRYAWFSGDPNDAALRQDALYSGDGSLTDLGKLYSRL